MVNNLYDFSTIQNNATYGDRRNLKKAIRNLLDGDYETQGNVDGLQPKLFGKPMRPLLVLGAGMQFKLNKKLSLSLRKQVQHSNENRFIGW